MSEALTSNGKDVRKFRVNGIPVRLRIPFSHPVAQGVVEGLNMVEDPMRHISIVTVLPDTKPYLKNRDLFSQGTCYSNDSGLSEIKIYAGSIGQTAHDQQTTAKTTVLHEVGHAVQEEQEHAGLWLDKKLKKDEEEKFAENFAFKQRQAIHSKRYLSGHHRRTIKDILEEHKSRKR